MAILSLYGCMTYDLNTTTGNAHIYDLIFCSFKIKGNVWERSHSLCECSATYLKIGRES